MQMAVGTSVRYAGQMEPTRDEIVAWLERAVAQTGDTPSGLARRAGLATTTLTRFLNDAGSPMLSLRSIAKIAHVAGVPPIGLSIEMAGAQSELREPEAVQYRSNEPQSLVANALKALIGGRASASPWVLKSRALDAIGYMPNDILIVDLNVAAAPGDIVCAQAYNWTSGVAETMFRLFEAPYLVGATADPTPNASARRPLLVDNDRVIIKGAVIAALRANPALLRR